MSTGEGDDVQFSLAPQWLRGHGLHSPIAAGSTAHGRQDATQPRASSSSDLSLQTPQHRNKGFGLGSSRSEERPSAFRSPGRRSSASSSKPQPGSHHSSKSSREDRYHSGSTPFSNGTLGAHSSSSSSSAASWLSHHAGPGHMAASGHGAAAANSQLSIGGTAAQLSGPVGLQRSVSEGYTTASSAGGKAFRKLALDGHDYPSLADGSSSSTSAHSSKRGGSPQPYTPSVAPYKQEFLASRGTSGWTSKLAVVPSSTDAEADIITSPLSPASATAAAADAINRRVALASSPAVRGPRSTATTVTSPQSPVPSLAQTLKHSVASNYNTAAEATKRHQKGLVTLLPSSKASPGSTITRTAVRKQADRAKHAVGGGGGGNRVKPLAPPPATASHAVSSGQQSFVPLSHSSSSSSNAGSAAAAAEGPINKESADLGSASSRQAALQQHQQQLTGSAGSTGTTEQRQQLRDRHNFFAVLRRKTSTSSSSGTDSSSGGTAVAKTVKSLEVQNAAGSQRKEPQSADVDAAGGAPRSTTAIATLDDDILAEDQQHIRHQVNSVTEGGPDHKRQQHRQLAGEHTVVQDPTSCVILNAVSQESSGGDALCTPGSEAGSQLQCQLSCELPASEQEEEEAFLRSLGWTAEASDDEAEWGLTEEEIAAFQAFAADRAAHQQQDYRVGYNTCQLYRYGTPSAAAQQQRVGNKSLAGGMLQNRKHPGGEPQRLGCAQQCHQRARALGAHAHCGLYGVPAAGQGYCGLLLGVFMSPVASLEFGCDSESSSDDEE